MKLHQNIKKYELWVRWASHGFIERNRLKTPNPTRKWTIQDFGMKTENSDFRNKSESNKILFFFGFFSIVFFVFFSDPSDRLAEVNYLLYRYSVTGCVANSIYFPFLQNRILILFKITLNGKYAMFTFNVLPPRFE